MSAAVWLGVAALGGLGALARHTLDGMVASRWDRGFPLGTLAVNISGALALGLLVGVSLEGHAYLLAATAVLGSYTTFSTWMLESHRLGQEGKVGAMLANLALSATVGLAAVAAGRAIGGLL